MNRRNGQWSFIDMLTMFDTFLQMADFQMTTQDLSNSDIMQAMKHQNREYLEKIIANQNQIISILSQMNEDMSVK